MSRKTKTFLNILVGLTSVFIVLRTSLAEETVKLLNYLNKHSKNRYKFELSVLPRKRLDRYIENGGSGVIPWVNNAWFKDLDESRYLWTNGFISGGDIIIVRKDSNISYKGPQSLEGKTIGSIIGFRFSGIDELVADGSINRDDSGSITQSLIKLVNGRVDAVIGPKSTSLFAMSQANIKDDLRVEPLYHSKYQRKFMILNGRGDIKDFLNGIVEQMTDDPLWQQKIANYE